MKLRSDRRGFVLSGAALLLVLPAMMLAASCLSIIGEGEEATSLQTLSDKVIYTAHDIKRVITYMINNKIPTDASTLGALAENYRAATGLLVDITAEIPQIVTLAREKLDSGEVFEYETTLFGFELDIEAENLNGVIYVDEFEFGNIENEDVQGTDFTLTIQQDNIWVDVIVGGGWITLRYRLGARVIRGAFIRVRDPRGAAQYIMTLDLE
ncbi:MAG: hypothetical protein QMD00_03030 [Hadesarchaea archaeon]|nr:hypothetical protein [Hadesarchaea archaeon]